MNEQETLIPECELIKKEYEIIIDNNKIRIEITNDKIIFLLIIEISYYQYIKEYKYNEIIKELNIEYKDIEQLYEYLIKSEYKIKKDQKKIIINNKEIKMNEIKLTNEEMINLLISEIKEIKEKSNKRIDDLIKKNEEKEKEINRLDNKYNELKGIVYEIDDNIKGKYKDEINIKYKTLNEGEYNIFGEEFAKNNEKNIELEINGKKSKLIKEYKLKKGENNIKMKIKNKITDLQYMFDGCKNLKNIDELKYLNTKYCNNFSCMFSGCSSLSDIKGLEKWNVSNGNNFEYMFYGCSSLSDIKALEKWNVSNCEYFESMF